MPKTIITKETYDRAKKEIRKFGIFIGLIVAKNVPILVPLIEDFFRFRIMPGDVFYVTEIPSIIIFNDIIIIGIVGFLLTSLATIYPARKAAKVNPAMILRYQ